MSRAMGGAALTLALAATGCLPGFTLEEAGGSQGGGLNSASAGSGSGGSGGSAAEGSGGTGDGGAGGGGTGGAGCEVPAGGWGALAQAILADCPVAYWPLDEPSGAIFAEDATGHGHTAELTGPVELGVEGVATTAAAIGPGGRLRVPRESVAWLGESAYSIELWLWPDVIDQNFRRAFDRTDYLAGAQRGPTLYFRNNGDERTGFEIWESGTPSIFARAAVELSMDRYVHLVAVHGVASTRLYIDGEPASGPGGAASSTSEIALVFGGALNGGGSAPGRFDEIAIYDRALTSEQVTAHFQAAASR